MSVVFNENNKTRNMRLKDTFSYSATIDWLQLEIETVSATNFWTIKNRAGFCHVEPIDNGLGGSANKFRFKLYDIESWNQVENIVKDLDFENKLANEPKVVGIEISLDAKSKNNSSDELIEHTVEMVRMLSNPLASNHNIRAAGKGKSEQLWLRKGKHYQAVKHSFYFGSQKDEDLTMRVYWKHTDRSRELPKDKHVSRIEITLKGASLPFKTIEEAKRYQFQKLSKWFKFRKVKEGLDSFKKMVIDASTQVGTVGTWKVRQAISQRKVSYRTYHPFTLANTELNTIAYDKLRQLTKRLNKTRVTRKKRLTHSKKPI